MNADRIVQDTQKENGRLDSETNGSISELVSIYEPDPSENEPSTELSIDTDPKINNNQED